MLADVRAELAHLQAVVELLQGRTGADDGGPELPRLACQLAPLAAISSRIRPDAAQASPDAQTH